jgi:hypothetical protein
MRQLTEGSVRGIAYDGVRLSHKILGVSLCIAAILLVACLQYLT